MSACLREEIREGARFSKALATASPSFDELYSSLVAAGEASGSLPEILRRLVVNLKQLFNLQRRTIGAMIYPIMVMLAGVVLLFVFSTVLMPSLSKMMAKTGQDLPFITEVLVRFTDFMAAWWCSSSASWWGSRSDSASSSRPRRDASGGTATR